MIENYQNSKFFISNASQIISNIIKRFNTNNMTKPLVDNIYIKEFEGKQTNSFTNIAFTPSNVIAEKHNKFSNTKEFLSLLEYFFNKKTLLVNQNVTFKNLKSWLEEHYTNSYNPSQGTNLKNSPNISFLDEANNRFLENILKPFNGLCNQSQISIDDKELLIDFIINAYLNALIIHAPMNRKYELNGHRKYIFHCLDVAESAVKRLIPKKDKITEKLSSSEIKDIAIHISVELLHDLIEDYHHALELDTKGIIKSDISFLDFLFKFSMTDRRDASNIHNNLDLLEITSYALFLIYLRSEPRSIIINEKRRNREQFYAISFRFVDVFDKEYYSNEIKELSSDELERYRTKLFGDIKILVDEYINGLIKLTDTKKINSKIEELISKWYDINKLAKLRYETILGKLDDNLDNLYSLYVYYFAYTYLYDLLTINLKNNSHHLDLNKSYIRRGVARFLAIYYSNSGVKESILRSSGNYYTSLGNYLNEVLSKERINQLCEEVTDAVMVIAGAKDSLELYKLSENAKKFSEKASFLFKKYFNYFEEVGKKLNEDYLLKILEIAYLERTKNRIELVIFNRENMLNPNFSIVRDLELWGEKVVIIDNDRKNMIIDFHKIVQENMNSYDIVIWKNGEIEIEIPYWIIAKLNGEKIVLSKLSSVIQETFGNVSFSKTESLNPRGLNNPLIIAINEKIDDYNKIHKLKERLEEEFFIP